MPSSIDAARLLRARGQRPGDGGAAEQRDELAPSHCLPQKAKHRALPGITLPYGNRRCPRHLPMLQWVIRESIAVLRVEPLHGAFRHSLP